MNILIITRSLGLGGAEKQAIIDANLLTEQSNNVSIAFHLDGVLSQLLNKNVRKIKLFTSNQLIVQIQLIFVLLKTRFNVIHAHMFWAEKVIAIPGFLLGQRIIFNEHGLGLWRKWYQRKSLLIASYFAHTVICSCKLNERIRNEREKIPVSKLITVHNSIASIAKYPKAKRDVFTIGYAGRFHPVKRLHTFIELANYCKANHLKVSFLLVGSGEELEELIKLVNKKELSEYFEFPDFKHDLIPEYKRMDIFILPSKIEAFSIALLEAGSHGLPLLAFDVGGNSEIVIDSITGYLIEEYYVDKMFEKITLLYNDHELLDRLSLSTKEYVEASFSHTSRIEKLNKIYTNEKE